jgi:hypothetical protein
VSVATNPDFKDLFSELNVREARYLVVGGYAVSFHARPRYTKDIDLWVEASPANASKIFAALAAFGAPMRELTAEDLSTPGIFLQLGVAPNRIDVLTELEGVQFEEAWRDRVQSSYDDVPIQFVSRKHLIRNKRAVGRPQDLLDAAILEEFEIEPGDEDR